MANRIDPSSPSGLLALDALEIKKLPPESFDVAMATMLRVQQLDRKENQILFYQPVSDRAMLTHESKAKVRGIGGGNGSSKTESVLAELVAKATGVFPLSLAHLIDEKFRGPINCRVIVESLTTVLEPIIYPKLQYFKWTGLLPQGGEQGHWGWVPRSCLKDGSWDRSYSQKYRTLHLLCRNPEDLDEVIGESTIQFMSHDQDPSDFASGDFHEQVLDEPPSHPIYTETEARAMRVDGNITLAMTWPDDPSIPVDWVFDKIYEPGNRSDNPNIDWFELHTTENKMLNQDSIKRQMGEWSDEMQQVRIFGRPIRFSNLIHPHFTDMDQIWCFSCNAQIYEVHDDRCKVCESSNIVTYNHVKDFDPDPRWPTVFLLDPHPRKPHMWLHVQVDPSDDLWVVSCGENAREPMDTAADIYQQERENRLSIAQRIMDPNMGRSPASAKNREETWQDVFDQAGLRCDLASDSAVGRALFDEFLIPDRYRGQPRIHFRQGVTGLAVDQIKRYAWDNYKVRDERAVKEVPRDKYDDYPTLVKYAMNANLSFNVLREGAPIIKLAGTRRKGYN
jgi:hypothetical protein